MIAYTSLRLRLSPSLKLSLFLRLSRPLLDRPRLLSRSSIWQAITTNMVLIAVKRRQLRHAEQLAWNGTKSTNGSMTESIRKPIRKILRVEDQQKSSWSQRTSRDVKWHKSCESIKLQEGDQHVDKPQTEHVLSDSFKYVSTTLLLAFGRQIL